MCQSVDREINNNNSLNLHECEDKDDMVDKRMQCENSFSHSMTTATRGFSRERIVQNSLKEIIQLRTMETETSSEVPIFLSLDSEESLTKLSDKILIKVENSHQTANESAEKDINNKEMITSDSERLELDRMCEERDVNQAGITTSNVPLINEREAEVTQSIGESMFPFHYLRMFKFVVRFECDTKTTKNLVVYRRVLAASRVEVVCRQLLSKLQMWNWRCK